MFAINLKHLTVAATLALALPALAADKGRDSYNKIKNDYLRCVATPAAEFPGTIVDAALATPDLKALADAVVAAGLAGTLSGPGPSRSTRRRTPRSRRYRRRY